MLSIGHGTGKRGRRVFEEKKRDIIYGDREKTRDCWWMRGTVREGTKECENASGDNSGLDTSVHTELALQLGPINIKL